MARRQHRPAQAPTQPAKRCAIYTRKSTAAGLDQEFNTLDAQYEACLGYVQRQPGWTVVATRYDDGGFTGANLDRPAFQQLMADIEDGKIDVLLTYKVDRVSRSLLDFAQVMDRLNRSGCAFVSVTQNFSTADAMGRLTLNMLMSFAEFEREMIAERIRDKVAASRRKGKWTGGPVPFGYEVKEKKLLVQASEARTVREAFKLFEQHRQMVAVADILNERGQLARAGQRLRPWTSKSISRLLRNPVYAGRVQHRGEQYPGEHQPLVDDEAFGRVQKLLDEIAGGKASPWSNPDYILRGLLFCGQCGKAMCTGSTRKRGREYRYYRCLTRNNQGPEACAAPQLPADAIEEHVVQHVAQVVAKADFVAQVEREFAARFRHRRSALERERAELPKAIASASSAASKLADSLANVADSARPVLERRINEASETLALLERRAAEVQRELRSLDERVLEAEWVTRTMRDFGRIWGVLTVHNRSRLLRALLDRVVVDESRNQVEIHMAALGTETEHGVDAA